MSAPTVTSVDTRVVPRSGTVEVVVTGANFDSTPVTGAVASVALAGGSGLSITDQSVDSATQMTLTVVATSNATTGFWDLTVTQTDGSDTLASAFTVAPTLASATPPARQIILYSFYHYASGSFDDGDRGFLATLISDGWSGTLDNGTNAGSYVPFQTEAAAQGCTLGLLAQNPFGRGSDNATVPVSGNSTSQRLDQRRQLWEDGFTGNASYADFIANTEPRETIVYVGSCWLSTSAGTFVGEGYYDLLNLGYSMAFDALTQHEGTTALFTEIQALDAAGFDVITEANGLIVDGGSQGLPAIAFAALWDLAARMQPEDAPDGSIWWWRTAANDGAWNLASAAAFLASGPIGTRRLAVRLDQLTESERTALYQLAAEYETYTNESYVAASVILPGNVAASVKVASNKAASVEIRQTVSASTRVL